MNEESPVYYTFATYPSDTIRLPAEDTPGAKVDAALERLQLHLTYGPYAGWKDTIREDVETVLEAWREYRRESEA